MIDDNPFEASTPAVVPDMSSEELVFGQATLSLFEPPSVMDPVSNLDFLPVDDAFSLEMRCETIEQLVGGDALRRGVSECIEAGRSQTNADLVAGRDRVRVHATLHEHTGHGRAEQAAHLHTTVDGTLDVHAASEDTVLLAGHMRELWDGGANIVAAMTDDTVAGGGIRVTTPLDLWVHGLMGVEERIGTCTADAVLMELGATHYEREYGPGAHAAGLAVYTGSLYQSSRSTFRALMRVSSGVRNLIAGGDGGEGEGGGRAPGASPPPVPAAGTQAASATLSAATGTGAGGTAQAGATAGVRSEDLTGIHRVDEVAALARGANVAAASGDLTELRRGTDTAGQLAALRDAMRGTGEGAEHEMRSVSRVSMTGDTASVHEASALDNVTGIPSGATVPGRDASVLHSTASPRPLPPGVKFGLLGGGGDPVRPASSDFGSWSSMYLRLRLMHGSHLGDSNWIATRAYGDAISNIEAKVIEAYVELGGRIDALPPGTGYCTVVDQAYRALQDLVREADGPEHFDRASAIEEILASVDRLTAELTDELRARTHEFGNAYVEAKRIGSLDPRIDAQKVSDWIEEQYQAASRNLQQAEGRGAEVDDATLRLFAREMVVHSMAKSDVRKSLDPRVGFYNRLRHAAETGDAEYVGNYMHLYERMLDVMDGLSIPRPAVQGSEAGGATPTPFRTVDSGAAGRLGDTARVPGPSSSATAGTDAGDSGRGMLDQPVVGPADEAHPGTAAPRSDDVQAMETPERGAQATFWLRPVDPVPAPGTVRFDAGLQRAGPQPQHSGEAAMGGTAVHRPFVPTPEDMLDLSDLTCIPSCSRDAFDIERGLIAGRLPPGFDSFRFMDQWRTLYKDIKFDVVVPPGESGLPTSRAIDSMTEQLRAVEGGRGHIQYIRQLEALKESIDRGLMHRYGHQGDADWLDKVDLFLKTGSAAQAVGVESVSVASRGEDIIEGARISLQPARVESAAPPGPTAGGAGALSPRARSPADDPWIPPWSQVDSSAGDLSPGALDSEEDPWGPPWSQDGSDAGELSSGALSPEVDPRGSPWRPVDSDAGELSLETLSLAQDPRSQWPRVGFGEVEVVGLDATQPVSSLGAGGRGIAGGPTGGWQAAETPGFGRLASTSAEVPLSRREQIVHRLMTGEALSPAQRSELLQRYERAIGVGTIASQAPRARTAAALLEDLRRLSTATRVSPAPAALEDIDWAAIELMLRLFDAPGL